MTGTDIIRLIVIGDDNVGKTQMMMRYTDNSFTTETLTTIGIDFKTKFLQIDGTSYKIQIWDTAGQERFRAIVETYYRRAHGIVLVYDISRQDTFDNLSIWFDSIAQHSVTTTPLIICGNKCDLEAVVSSDDAEDLARAKETELFLTSAWSGERIDDAFLSISRKVVQKRSTENEAASEAAKQDVTVDLKQGKGKKKKGGCDCVI
jgi:Ras-related protein Rab-1A